MDIDNYLKNIQLDIDDMGDQKNVTKADLQRLKVLAFQIGCVREEIKRTQ